MGVFFSFFSFFAMLHDIGGWGLILHMSLCQLDRVIQNPMNSFHTMEIMKCILNALELLREVRIKRENKAC